MGPILPCIQSAPEASINCDNYGVPPLVCIVGFTGSGKTTVTVGLVSALKRWGLRVGTIKHDVHGFELDRPGKDSWGHKQAGASVTVVTSPKQIGMVMDVEHDHHPLEMLHLMSGMDIVLAEGFKRTDLPKIEVYRPENSKPPACKGDSNLIAVISDAPLEWGVPRFSSKDLEKVANFILQRLRPKLREELSCKIAV